MAASSARVSPQPVRCMRPPCDARWARLLPAACCLLVLPPATACPLPSATAAPGFPCPRAAQLWQNAPARDSTPSNPDPDPFCSARLPPAAQAQVLKTDNLEMLSGVKATNYTFSDGSVTGVGLPFHLQQPVSRSGLERHHSHMCISADAGHTCWSSVMHNGLRQCWCTCC